MWTRKNAQLVYRVLLALAVGALLLLPAGAPPAVAASGPSAAFAQTTVSVSNLVLFPPNPYEAINISGDFLIQAYIVFPPNPYEQKTIVTLQLDATGISGVGQTTGLLYRGTHGPSRNYQISLSDPIAFDAAFPLVPEEGAYPPNPYFPPNPSVPAQVGFQVQVLGTEPNFVTISATLVNP